MATIRLPWVPGVPRRLSEREVAFVCQAYGIAREAIEWVDLLDGQLTVRKRGVIDEIKVTVQISEHGG